VTFIVLEGIDGSGTTTQAATLADKLRAQGREVVLTREPTTGPVGRFLRQALSGKLTAGDGAPAELGWSALALLFSADRLDHLEREIEPALSRGALVISDRYDLSSLIYQSATCPEGEAAVPWLRELNARARRPDLTLVLDVSPEVAEKRRSARASEPEIFEKAELQRRLAGLYKRSAAFVPEDRIELLPGDGGLDEVAQAIEQAVQNLPEFGKKAPVGR
jgi:dTMP kinase